MNRVFIAEWGRLDGAPLSGVTRVEATDWEMLDMKVRENGRWLSNYFKWWAKGKRSNGDTMKIEHSGNIQLWERVEVRFI